MRDRIDRLFLKMTLALLALPCSLAYGTHDDGGDDIGAAFLGNSADASAVSGDQSEVFDLATFLTFSVGRNPFL